jgi:hypothetical protein
MGNAVFTHLRQGTRGQSRGEESRGTFDLKSDPLEVFKKS